MDSDSSETGRLKRKEREELFGRKPKIQRTPKKKYDSEDKMDMLIGMMKELKEDLKQMKDEQQNTHEEVTKIREENRILHEENQQLKKENKDIKEQLNNLENKMEWLERQRRKNNVIMHGLKMDTPDNNIIKQMVKTVIEDKLEINVQIKSAQKIGGKTCIIELESEEDKEKVMKNKNKLRNLTEQKIYINNDETIIEREKNREIRNFAKMERNKGKNVKIGYNKVTVQGNVWKWKPELKKMMPNPENTVSKN